MIIVGIAIMLLLGIIGVWMISSVLYWVLFARIFKRPVTAKFSSILATWAILLALSLGRDPLYIIAYTLGAAVFAGLAYWAGRGIDRESDKAAAVGDVFE